MSMTEPSPEIIETLERIRELCGRQEMFLEYAVAEKLIELAQRLQDSQLLNEVESKLNSWKSHNP
jgi:hypothetical protein